MKGQKENKNTSIIKCVTNENKQSGISILDYYVGTINILECEIANNKDYGLFLSCHNPSTEIINQTLSTGIIGSSSSIFQSKIFLVHGEIFNNKKGGIYLNHQHTKVDCTIIKDNEDFAIHLAVKSGEKDLSFTKETMERNYINGIIGGLWGRIGMYNKSVVCGCTDRKSVV